MEQIEILKINKYPELDKISMEIAKQVETLINSKAYQVESKMPYKAQYILEELVNILEEAI